MEKKHNGIISFWKFIFAMAVVMSHAVVFAPSGFKNILLKGGSIGVEFFFITSGYLMAKKVFATEEASPNLGKESFGYVFNKFKALFPYILVSWGMGLFVKLYVYKYTLQKSLTSVWELLCVGASGLQVGFGQARVNSPLWYLAAMFVCMLIIYPLLRKYKNTYASIVAPIIVILLSGWLMVNFKQTFRDPFKWVGFTYKGMLRGFIELNIGIITFKVSEKIKGVNFNGFGRFILTILEMGLLVCPLLINHFDKKMYSYDSVVVLMMAVAIAIIFAGQTLELKLFNNKLFYHLERISLTIYMINMPIREYFRKNEWFAQFGYYKKTVIFVGCVLVAAEVLYILITLLRKFEVFPKLGRALFIKKERTE